MLYVIQGNTLTPLPELARQKNHKGWMSKVGDKGNTYFRRPRMKIYY
jgi:hypothetical protein